MKFSVITVVYNGGKYLDRAIRSVIEQKNVDIEYIIIDGGSTDNTLEIIKKYSDKIYYWISEPDNGVYDAMNKGLQVATGDIVSFLNSDDWYEDNIFSVVSEHFEDAAKNIVYGRVNKIENNKADGFVGIYSQTNPEMLHLHNLYCHQGLFIKKKIFEVVGNFDTKYKIYADYDWNLRAYNRGYSFYVIPEIAANFRFGGLCTTHSLPREFYEICMKELNGRKEFIPQIEEEYKLGKENKAIELLINDNSETLQGFFRRDAPFFIWGVGLYGKECLRLLNRKGISVLGFIDSNPIGADVGNITVYSSSYFFETKTKELVENNISFGIIITPRKYEDEITKQIIQNRTELEKDIIQYTQIRAWACTRYDSEMDKL